MLSQVISNIPKIQLIYDTVENNIGHYVDHLMFGECDDKNLVSIVMTTHNRIVQTLFTLETIRKSQHLAIQIVIVDDSTKGFLDDFLRLQTYPFRIDYLKIKNKCWTNSCVNYNIAFKFVLGENIIIQNAEVCHFGDVISYVSKTMKNNHYLVFDVVDAYSYQNNQRLYSIFTNHHYHKIEIDNFIKSGCHWHQHSINRPYDLHFLTAIHASDLKKLGGFDYDFSLGRWWDDNEFSVRIKRCLKLEIIRVSYEETSLLGIHQHHDTVYLNATQKEYDDSVELNKYIIKSKERYLAECGKWISLHESPDLEEDVKRIFKDKINI